MKKQIIRFKEICNRLTGFSVPLFGVQWNPPKTEIQLTRRVITFLEDRRVLYNPSDLEIPEHCVHSVIEIRHFLTEVLHDCTPGSEIANHIRAMRAGCRKFLDTVQSDDRHIITFGSQHNHCSSWVFQPALGELRATFGIHLAQLAVRYGCDLEGELIKILPVEDTADKAKSISNRNESHP